MVGRLQKLNLCDSTQASPTKMETNDHPAQPDVTHCHHTLLDETVLEEPEPENSVGGGEDQEEDEEEEGGADTAAAGLNSLAGGKDHSEDTLTPLCLGDCASSVGGDDASSYLTDLSFDEGCTDRSLCDSPRKSRQGGGRDRSNTWSHNALRLAKTAKRSGSLPKLNNMECGLSPAVSRLSLDRGDSPFPTTPTCLTPRLGRLLVCSEHRMSTSPRLPPIGLNSQSHLPKNTPRELSREVTLIDPALVEHSDPTDVRMVGRRRNALLLTTPPSPEEDS